MGQKIKSLFTGAKLAALGAGVAIGIGLSVLPPVRRQLDALIAKAVA